MGVPEFSIFGYTIFCFFYFFFLLLLLFCF